MHFTARCRQIAKVNSLFGCNFLLNLIIISDSAFSFSWRLGQYQSVISTSMDVKNAKGRREKNKYEQNTESYISCIKAFDSYEEA